MAEQIISPGVFQRESDQTIVSQGAFEVGAAIIGPTVTGAPFVPTYVSSYSEYLAIFGDIFPSGSNYYEYFTSLAAKNFFNNGGSTLLVTRIISGSPNLATYASSTVPSSGSSATASFELETISWGSVMNNSGSILGNGALQNGTSRNVRWEVSYVDPSRGTFTLLVRSGDDTNSSKNILETWNNLSLDPMQPNFISRVVGDTRPVYMPANGTETAYIDYQGNYPNNSRYIRVKSINVLHANSIDGNGTFNSASYQSTLPAVGSGSNAGAFSGGIVETSAAQFMNENITDANVQGFGSNDYIKAVSILANKEEYQFNYIIAPGVTLSNAAVNNLISLCETRGDCMVILDTYRYGGSIPTVVSTVNAFNTNYGATYWPWVKMFSSNLGRDLWCPASTAMLGVYAFNDRSAAEWFAPAGLNRGGITSVSQVEKKLGQANRDLLYNANINPLASFPGQGVVVWGQKTLQKKSSALDRVNVRRLLITLKSQIGRIANNLVFEQNTNATRNRFLSQVNPYLDSVVQRQGLYAYKVVMDDSNNGPEVIDRNQLVGSIQIQPTRTAEFIILTFNILPTGATFE